MSQLLRDRSVADRPLKDLHNDLIESFSEYLMWLLKSIVWSSSC